MGCFDFTCALSGLPIEPGDPIRYMLLTQNPYQRGKTATRMLCYSTDAWFPRTFPLRGKYDWYGRAEDLQAGPMADAWLAGFRCDLIEKGWGDNTCHDVPTRKTDTLDDLLEAVREGRVLVRQNVGDRDLDATVERAEKLLGDAPPKRGAPKVPAGIPTRRRVERALSRLPEDLAEELRTGVYVTRVDANTVRVRARSGAKTLAKLRDHLAERWAGMVTCDTGSYADSAALLLRPLPGVREYAIRRRDKRPGLCVAHVMIREDVWQAICRTRLVRPYDGDATIEQCREAVSAAWSKAVDLGDTFGRFMMRHDAYGITGDAIPFTVGLGTSWWHMVTEYKAGRVTDAERDDFLNTASELAFVMRWMSTVRFLWHPAGGCPQSGEWRAHATLLAAYQQIADEQAGAEERRREEDA